MKTLITFLATIISATWVFANQGINTQKLELQKNFISNINLCKNPSELNQFFKIALDNVSSNEKKAKVSAFMEELIKYNPSCFVASIKKLDQKSCELIEESYLDEPFFYPREELRASLTTAKNYNSTCLAS
jgi:hypothetical protein